MEVAPERERERMRDRERKREREKEREKERQKEERKLLFPGFCVSRTQLVTREFL